MGNVQKVTGPPRQDGTRSTRWRAATKDANGKRVSKYFDRKGDGQTWLREVETAGVVGASDKTMVHVAEAHYRHFDKLVKAGKREAVTRDGYATAIERHLKADAGFAATALCKQTTPKFQNFLDGVFERTGSLDLARRLRRVLVTWCDFAIRKGDLAVNHATACKVETTDRPDETEDRVEIPEKTALSALLRAAGEGDNPERDTAVVRLLMFGGLRISEMLGLADDAVPIAKDGGELQVRERLDRHYEVLGKIKTKKARRDVPVGPAAAAAIKTWRVKRGPAAAFNHHDATGARDQRPGRLFPHPDGRPLWGYIDFIRQCWTPVMRRAGLTEVRPDGKGKNRVIATFGPHTLRHVSASLWIAQDLQPKRVQELLGHGSLAMTMDLYGHLWRDSQGDAALARRSEASIS